MSDLMAKRFGMRGRLWWLWSCQTIGGLMCLSLGLVSTNFTATMIILVFFSVFIQGACGATFGVVPFVSKRALGLVCGMVGAGGSAGSAITQVGPCPRWTHSWPNSLHNLVDAIMSLYMLPLLGC